jgi:hypothetical protein
MAFNPRPEFVDFGSAFDGPVIDDPNAEGNQVYIDKIVVCEHCVKQAARLLNLDDVSKHMAENETLAEEITQLDQEIVKKDKAIADLTHTVGTLLDHPVKRPAGRPQLRGPETHEEEIKDLRSSRARANKVSKAKKKASNGSNGQ